MAGDTSGDLSRMEYEFATNPNSEAFIPLAQAYLTMGRFVEAMVVCKKGIKAHPEMPIGRLIMARIYADQAKHQKAIEELSSLLKLSPENSDAFRLLGNIHIKLGKQEDAVQFLKKALDFNPSDREAKDTLLKIGIDYVPASAAPKVEPLPSPVVQQPSSTGPTTPSPTPAGGVAVSPQMLKDAAASRRISERPTEKSFPAVATPAPTPNRKRIADIYQEMETVNKKPAKGKGLRYSLYLGGALLVALIIYVLYAWQAGKRQEQINTHMEEGRKFFNQDTYVGYNKALENYRAIIKLDSSHGEALARAAFACAVLVGEYGADKALIAEGNKFINEAKNQEQSSIMLIAARSLMIVYGGGNKNDAVKLLEDGIKKNPDNPVLRITLGTTLLSQGKLAEAAESFKSAKSNDPRVLTGLGDYAMRRSMYREAAQAYNMVLASDRGHLKSLIFSGLLALIRGSTGNDNKYAEEVLKKYKEEFEKDASEKEKNYTKLMQLVLNGRTGDKKKALAELKEFEGRKEFLESGNELVHFLAAREFRRYGSIEDAKQSIERALRIDSSRPDFVLEEAQIYLDKRDYEGARSRALRVESMDAESGQSAILVGEAYRKERNYDKAMEYFKKAKDFADVEATAHLRLGQVFLERPNPDKDKAQAELETAMSGLVTAGDRREAAETCFALAKIYAEKNLREKFGNIIKQALQIDPSYPPPHALIAGQLDMSSKEGKDSAKERCDKYLQLDPGNEFGYGTFCRELLKKIK